ncbi:MAG: ABC transporter ATP-binding protein, partial [Acidobacteriota bacterium]|nr:ABC transporter ATP-binding protein [Acidobacteriota bacterium]
LLDEPTNDLDIPTLEVLESNLADFPGAIVLVTHDRFLLDRLSTILLAMNGEGKIEFFAELAQWEQAALSPKSVPKTATAGSTPAPKGKKKLTYLEAREWEGIEELVARAEEELDRKRTILELPDVVSDHQRLTVALREMDVAQAEVDRLYARWAELEARQA